MISVASLLRFGPWAVAALGLLVGTLGVRGCAAGLEDRGAKAAQIAALELAVQAERDCDTRSTCAARAAAEALAAERLLAERVTEIRDDNERRVAAAVSRYVNTEAATRRELERALRELEQQKNDDPACAVWAGDRVACIVRPLGPADAGRHETDPRRTPDAARP